MDDLSRELRIGIRRLLKKPGDSLLMVLTLALCIGAAASMFSVIRAIFVDPFPYEDHDRLVYLNPEFPALGREDYAFSVPEYLDLAAQEQIFEHHVAGIGQDFNLLGGGRPERVLGAAITAGGFDMLGVQPVIGRTFTAEEDRPGGPDVAVISYSLWQRRFGAAEDVLGRQLETADHRFEIIGVMPERFEWWNSELWIPLRLDTTQSDRSDRYLTFMGRLVPGVDLERATSELQALARRLEAENGSAVEEYESWRIHVTSLLDEVIRNVRPALITLLAAVGLLFALACLNLANFLLVRVMARSREFAVSLALGSGYGRITRQLFVESLLISVLGGLVGFLLSWWGTKFIVALIPAQYIPAEARIGIDLPIFGVTVVAGVIAGLVIGLLPAIQVRRFDLLNALKEGGRHGSGGRQVQRVHRVLVVAEVALALAVVTGAALMVRSFLAVTSIDLGFEPEGVLSFRVELSEERYPEPHHVVGFFERAAERLGNLPGVVGATPSFSLPMEPGFVLPITVEGKSAEEIGAPPEAQYEIVGDDYFDLMGIRRVAGRTFEPSDSADAQPVVIINETLAHRFFPDKDAVGKRMKRGAADSEYPWRVIVGVVEDVKQEGLEIETRQSYYVPYDQAPIQPRYMAMVVRAAGAPKAVVPDVRRAMTELDPENPIFEVQTLEERVENALGARRLTLVLLVFFAGLALLLAALGIFGVMAWSVSQRTGEIGVRRALGADNGSIFRLILGQALRLTVFGIAGGVLLAAYGSRLLGSLVQDIGGRDPLTFFGVALFFVLVALAASFLPARRAVGLEPTLALREE